MKEKKEHDLPYKYLFSNKKIFYELITSFVKEDFVKKLSYDDIELVENSFVSQDFAKREADVIYKVNFQEEGGSKKEAYIYILLEFQSTVDKTIPVRMGLYIFLLYDFLMRKSQKGKLPSVFPLLLYNGEKDWTIPTNISELIEHTIPSRYIPSFEYYKIIIKDIPEETLLEIHNIVSAVMYLEKQRNTDKLDEMIAKVVELIKKEDIIDIKLFTNWVKHIFNEQASYDDFIEINNLTEAKGMLSTLVEKIKEEEKQKGIEQGIEQGIKKGIKKGLHQKALETAKKMKKEGLPSELIMKITGLTKEEIEKL